MADSIIRLDPDEDGPAYMMARATAQDGRLPWDTWGLLSYLHSLPRDWRLSPADLVRRRKGGRKLVYRMLRELRAAGYMTLREVRDPNNGQIERYEYFVRMRPLAPERHTAERHTAEGHNTEETVEDSRRESTASPPPPSGGAAAEQIRSVFEAWKGATGRNGTTVLDDKRKKAIKSRLAEGFSPEQLVAAVEAIPRSDFHNGRDPKTEGHTKAQLSRLTELTLHLRDAPHVEYLLQLAPAAPDAPAREHRPGYVVSDEELLRGAPKES